MRHTTTRRRPDPRDKLREQVLAHLEESGSVHGTAFALDVHPVEVSQLQLEAELVQRVRPSGERRAIQASGPRRG